MNEPGALAGLRILDLTDHKAALCGRILADMGADVIKVEPPGGDRARRIGPFLDDLPHPDRSLFFWFYNLNKRSLTLDLGCSRGVDLLLALASTADVVIESFAPGELDRLGLGWQRLHRQARSLILCSLAPFGQTGPYRDFIADDTSLAALGGMLYVNGFPEQAPIRPLGLQSYHCGAEHGAIAIVCALLQREQGGQGQWIDLSIQEATAAAVEQVAASYFGEHKIDRRQGTLHWSRFFRVGSCRDGYVVHCTLGDWTSLIQWVAADGKAQDLIEPQWNDALYRAEHAEQLFDVLEQGIKDYDCAELASRAQALRLAYGVVRPPEALLGDEQLAARGFFVEVEHPELGRTFRYPGAPFRLGAAPRCVYRRPPLIGEHSGEILKSELGLETDQLAALAAEGVI